MQVHLSSKYQLVIPKKIRQQTAIKKHQRFFLFVKDSIIYLIPEVKLSSLKGILKGKGNKEYREKGDRL